MSKIINRRGFASDNNAGVHPSILAALPKVNDGHVIAYGDDPYTEKASAQLREIFGQETEVFFVFIGTAANVLGLSTVTQSYHAVICPETAHINVDECGAPEKFSGCKLLTCSTPDGKLTVDMIASHMHGIGFEHHVQPRVVSITQATELGTVYTLDEIKEIARYTHEHGMLLHMDGARISNAAVSLDCGFYEMTGGAGVDVLSFGGTKNGMMYGEAIIFFNPTLCEDFKYRRKQGMQLASKMRFISAQFECYLSNDLWLKNALHANKMARLLAEQIAGLPGVKITQKVVANGVFAIIPGELIPILQKEYFFYIWNEELSEVRWMTSFDTTEEDVRNFAGLIKKYLS